MAETDGEKILTDVMELDGEFSEQAEQTESNQGNYPHEAEDEQETEFTEQKQQSDTDISVCEAIQAAEEHAKILETMFQTKIMADEQKSRIIDSLHSELQAYKDDMYARIFKPLLVDLIYFKEDMKKMLRGIKTGNDGASNEKLVSVLEGYCLDLDDIFEKYDVKVFDCEQSEYVPIRQKIIKILPTESEELDGKVAEKLSDGYELNGKVIFQQRAVVYKFNQNNGGDK